MYFTQDGGAILGNVTAMSCSFMGNTAGDVSRFPNHALECARFIRVLVLTVEKLVAN